MKQIRCLVAALLLTGTLATECVAKKKTPPPVDSRLLAVQNISVLPIADARAGKKEGVNLDKLRSHVVNVLTHKHYTAGAAVNSGAAGEIAIEDIEAASLPYIKKLGPANERWVMVVFLDDITSKLTLGSTGNAEISGFLFDKESAELIWSGKGVGQAGQGGLIGMPMKGMMKGEALGAAVFNLLAGLPNRPKPGK